MASDRGKKALSVTPAHVTLDTHGGGTHGTAEAGTMTQGAAVTSDTPIRRTRRTYTPRARKCKAPGCTNEFTPKAGHGRYCSDICRKRAQRARAAKSKKGQKAAKYIAPLTMAVCAHCENEFLATEGRGARFCSDNHKTRYYRARREAAVQAIAQDRGMTAREAEQVIKSAGMEKVARYLEQIGYFYDHPSRAWLQPFDPAILKHDYAKRQQES